MDYLKSEPSSVRWWMSKTNIEWTEHTYNVVSGCTKVTPGCDNCYAIPRSYRIEKTGVTDKYNGVSTGKEWTGKVIMHWDKLHEPFTWRKPRMVFVNSMSDTFHCKVSLEFLRSLWYSMRHNQKHTFQVLSKRPEQWLRIQKDYAQCMGYPNIWAMTTCENQAMLDKRLPILLQIDAPVRGISVEPMLEPMNLYDGLIHGLSNGSIPDRRYLHWIVVGCESGPIRRPCELSWVRDLRDQCRELRIALFVKQLLLNGKVVKDMAKFPEDLRIREMPI